MTTLAIRQASVRLVKMPLVLGFLGALLGLFFGWAIWSGYGWARWHLYGRNEARITTLEQEQSRITTLEQMQARIVAYLQQQEAAKQGK